MSKNRIIYLSFAIIAAISLAFILRDKGSNEELLVYKVKKDAFEMLVYSTV